MDDDLKIAAGAIVIVLILGIFIIFTFRNAKTVTPNSNNPPSYYTRSFPNPPNDDEVLNNFRGSPLRNARQPRRYENGSFNYQPSTRDNYREDILSSQHDEDIDFNNFLVDYNDILFGDNNIVNEYSKFRSTLKFKRNVSKANRKLNLKNVFEENFHRNSYESRFFDKIQATIRLGLKGFRMCDDIRRLFNEDPRRSDDLVADICRKIRTKVSREYNRQDLVKLIKEKELLMDKMRIGPFEEDLINYTIQAPYIKEKDIFNLEPYMELLVDITNDSLKILGFSDLFSILLMRPFHKIKYRADSSDKIAMKQKCIFYFNRALFQCYSRFINYTRSFTTMTTEKRQKTTDEYSLCDILFTQNKQAFHSGTNPDLEASLHFCITRYFVIVCFMWFSCSGENRNRFGNSSRKVRNPFDNQDRSLYYDIFSNLTLQDASVFFNQIFHVINKSMRLFYSIINPDNTLNNEFISSVKSNTLDIAFILDEDPVLKKLFSAFFEIK